MDAFLEQYYGGIGYFFEILPFALNLIDSSIRVNIHSLVIDSTTLKIFTSEYFVLIHLLIIWCYPNLVQPHL